jgi:tape measure domain-containing protein
MLNEVKIKYVVDSSELAKATAEFDKLTKEEQQANAALDKFQENLRDTGAAGKSGTAPVVDGLDKATNSAVKFGAAINKNQAAVKAFTTQLREAGAVAVKAGNQASAGFSGMDATIRRNQASLSAFQRQLGSVQAQATQIGGGAKGGGTDLIGQLSGMLKIGGRFLIAKQIYDTTMAMAEMGAKVESLNAQFKFLTGTASGAQMQLEEIKDLANNFGINVDIATTSYKNFATASVLAGQSLEATNDQFKSVMMASRAMGLSTEQTENAFRALQQALSKGVLSAEELRGQLSEAIPGAFTMTAHAIGVSEQELNKMIASGGVMSKDVLPLLALQMKQTFGAQTLEMTDSMGASFERFGNTIGKVGKVIAMAYAPVIKYVMDSIVSWADKIENIYDKLSMGSDEYTAKQKANTKKNIEYNAELEIAQMQVQIARERGIKAEEVTRADASRRALAQTTKAYDALRSQAEGFGRTDPMIKAQLESANIRRNILMKEVATQKEADKLSAKIREDANKANIEKDKKASKAKADKEEKERLAKVKADFDAEKTRIEDAQKIAQIELEASKKDEATKAEEKLKIEEKYLQDLIALRERYAKKEPKLATQFTKGIGVERAQLGAVQGEIPTAGMDIRMKQFAKEQEALEKLNDDRYKAELKGAESRATIRESEIQAMEASEQKKRRLTIESQITANNETMAINEKFMNEGNENALNAVDTQNQELIAKNKALQKELTAIDKEGNQERADLVSQWGQHIASVFNGAMNLYQQNLSAELDATQARYSEEERLAGDNKQKLTELREKQRMEEAEIKRKQFEAQKIQAVAEVVFQTAPIIAKYGAEIFTIPLALAAVAAQAAQIGFILAQPVPEFAEGTQGTPHKGGLAMVGEKGVERVVTKSGKVYYTPPTATLVDLPKGAEVIPNHQLRKELHYASNMSRASSGNGFEPMISGITEIGGILKSLPIHQINMDERGFEKYIRTPRRATKILNNRFPGN